MERSSPQSSIVNVIEEQRDDMSTLIDIQTLAEALNNEIGFLPSLSDENNSIYRVPKQLRELNEKVYTPQVVSIGPLHHNTMKLRPMEEHKRRYLQDFLRRTEGNITDYLLIIKVNEERLRNSYAEDIKLGSDEFLKMILVDAAFIIEIMLKSKFSNLQKGNDRMFTKPWMIVDILFDMCLLENQLPLFILKELFQGANISMSSSNDNTPPIIKLIHGFAEDAWDFSEIEYDSLEGKSFNKVEHLVDFLHICLVPPESERPMRMKLGNLTIPSVTELHQAGVKFKRARKRRLFDIKFNKGRGILEIPHLKIVKETELFFRNLLAFEQCHGSSNFITEFVVFINQLVNTPKDVDLLVQNGIIENWLSGGEAVSTLFHNLIKETPTNHGVFYFPNVVDDLNIYYQDHWREWKVTLKEEHLKTPWAVLSVIAAVVLLVLSFIQAVCSVLQVV